MDDDLFGVTDQFSEEELKDKEVFTIGGKAMIMVACHENSSIFHDGKNLVIVNNEWEITDIVPLVVQSLRLGDDLEITDCASLE